jgi:mRNA-degrading endonuclease YafQ of YafQ-DinJ toxin-antitoxin module
VRLRPTGRFERRARKLPVDQQRALSRALRLLAVDPRDARLRTHKLEGGDRWACSYAYDGRIVFNWAGDLITLLDLGTHDEVY